MTYFFRDLENLMRQALTTALVTLIVVWLTGVIFGWEYALWAAFVVIFAITITAWRR